MSGESVTLESFCIDASSTTLLLSVIGGGTFSGLIVINVTIAITAIIPAITEIPLTFNKVYCRLNAYIAIQIYSQFFHIL